MQITDSARDFLQNFLDENNQKGLIFQASGHGCHTRLKVDTTDEAIGIVINGLYCAMDDSTAECLENLVIDTREGKLVFMNSCHGNTNCGDGCGGCNH